MSPFVEARHQVRMEAFISRFASADEEWPAAWALVRVEPEGWMCTLPLAELVRCLQTTETDAHLRGVPHSWSADGLTMGLGPVSVTASADEWLRLCRRLIDTGVGAEHAVELPDTQPWTGRVEPTAIDEIVIGDTVAPTPRGPRELIADAGGFTPDEVTELLGHSWSVCEDAYRPRPALDDLFADPAAPRSVDLELGDVLLWGDPCQLGALISADGRSLWIGVPKGRWVSTHELEYELTDLVSIGRHLSDDTIGDHVRTRLTRRRRTMRWCRYCGDRFPPEWRFGEDACDPCAVGLLKIIH